MSEITQGSLLAVDVAGEAVAESPRVTPHVIRRLVARAWWLVCLLPAAVLLAVALSR
jgi:hypothetical protein